MLYDTRINIPHYEISRCNAHARARERVLSLIRDHVVSEYHVYSPALIYVIINELDTQDRYNLTSLLFERAAARAPDTRNTRILGTSRTSPKARNYRIFIIRVM